MYGASAGSRARVAVAKLSAKNAYATDATARSTASSRVTRGRAHDRRTSRRRRRPARDEKGNLFFAGDEALEPVVGHVVGPLFGRRLHEVRGGGQQPALEAAIERDLAAPDGVDDHAGRVRRVPHLELELDVDRLIAEALALEADVRPLAVLEPRDVVAGAAVHAGGP